MENKTLWIWSANVKMVGITQEKCYGWAVSLHSAPAARPELTDLAADVLGVSTALKANSNALLTAWQVHESMLAVHRS